jgi:subtilisin family serine protease
MRHTTVSIAALFLAVIGGACVDEALRPAHGGEGGSAGEGGEGGGSGGVELPTRGDPADFPSTCVESCEQACDALEACDAGASSVFPLDDGACRARCQLQEGGPFWGDQSAHFKCCASQESCDAVQHCGGWLAHPDADASCDQLCNCFFSSEALVALQQGHAAPAPYRFAPHALFLELADERAALPSPGARVTLKQRGRFLEATLWPGSAAHSLATLATAGKVLPTFVDAAGRLSAATGRVYLRPPTSALRASAAAIAHKRAGTPPAPTRLSKSLYSFVHADPWAALASVAELRAAGIPAELDMVRPHRFHYLPNDPLFADQWHLENGGQGVSTAGVDARVSEAWDVTLGDPQVIVAINDDGVDLDHLDFAGRLEPELNFPADWRDLLAQGTFGGHGTSVTGVAAAAADDQLGGAGACPGCRVLPHRLAETDANGSFMLTDQEAAAGFERQVDAGAWVINNSWGLALGNALYADEDIPSPPTPMVIDAAFQYAETSGRGGLGTVVVFAAGNENAAIDYYGGHPLPLAVAAIGDVGLKAYYSCHGPEIDVGAPSNGGLTGITTSAAGGGYTDSFGGTSSASPLVAGVVGLVFSANPALTAAEARALLAASATPIDPVFGDYQAGHSEFYGAGMVNAYTAVRMASGSCADRLSCPPPSDACGASCGTRTTCGVCRTQADCAADHVCQALPSLGRTVCVAAKQADPCPEGTVEKNGYCLPLPATCGLCLGSEECNGRDDDCDDLVDEDDACNGSPRCFIDSLPCAEGSVCAGPTCVATCASDQDCGEGFLCRTVKDQYGGVSGQKGCVQNLEGGCPLGCSVLASSLDDATLAELVACMMDGQTACDAAFGCSALLPVQL